MAVSKEEQDRKKYSKATLQQFLNLRKQIKALNAMPALVAARNRKLYQSDMYNGHVNYEKLRGLVNSSVPMNQANNDMKQKVIRSLFS